MNVPIKVLIVEDETIIRNEVSTILDWEAEGYIVVGQASNGKKGLEMVELYKPDIILLDIKMPHMDGIEFMAQLKKIDARPKIIILSSYDDFSYASHAIDYGVVDYILKHQLTREKMLRSLEKAKTLLINEKENEIMMDDFKKQITDVADIKKELLLREIIGGVTPERYQQIRKSTALAFDGSEVCVIAVQAVFHGRETGQSNAYDALLRSFLERIRDLISNYSGGEACFYSVETICILLNSPKTSSLMQKRNTLDKILKLIRETAASLGIGDFYVNVGPVAETVTDINESVSRTVDMAKYDIFYDTQSIVYYHELTGLVPANQKELESTFSLLMDAVQISEQKFFFDTIDTLFEMIAQKKDFEAYRHYVLRLYSLVKVLEIDNNVVLEEISEPMFYMSLYHTKDRLKKVFAQLFELILEKESCSNRTILRTIRFIKENYADTLDLNTIAREVNVSRTYLSALFKQKTSVNLMEYLARFRIDKAKELMESSDARIYEIAESVGIPDTKYFCKLFKKYTGFTPSKFKTL